MVEIKVSNKVVVIGTLILFSLLFALSPSHEVVRPSPSSPEMMMSQNVPNSLRNQQRREDDEGKKAYPVYESVKSNEQQVNLTPEELENLPLRHHSSDFDSFGENELEDDEDGSWFEDQKQYDAAPFIKVLAESKRIKYRMIVLQHERFYRNHPSKLYVPRLKKTAKLTIDDFAKHFLFKTQPVIIPFEAMRHLNFTTKSYTIDELMELYPNHKPALYKYGMHLKPDEEIDLGPAIAALKQDKDLKKTKQGRNFPRNLKVNPAAISMLDVQFPPYVIGGTKMMAPAVWFGVTSSSTATHSDCCDNFAMMISGTKRWTIAPPSEARIIKPKCQGGLCWGNKIEHADEHAYTAKMRKARDNTQLITFDLRPGELLYLPCGWFHHVENVGPTIMVNFWTKDKPFFLQYVDGDVSE